MPLLSHANLISTCEEIFRAAGASDSEATTVADLVVEANVVGHDSHGVRQLPDYIARIRKGHIVPGAAFEIVRETSTTTVIDGHWGFGFVVSTRAMEITIEKAKAHGVAATTISRQGHVGRVSAYPIMATQAGLIGMMTADSGRSPKSVAPFGGREARLGTNPICFAVPSNLDGTFFLDMATSACAVGKIRLAQAKGERLPEGWLIDADGHPTTDPNDYGKGGVVLPLGGSEAHKGYGLSAMVEVMSGILTGLGFGVEPTGRHNDGCFIAAFDVNAFRDLETFKEEVTDFAKYLNDTPPAEGFERVLYPGEIEHMKRRDRMSNGISIDDNTWQAIQDLRAELGLN